MTGQFLRFLLTGGFAALVNIATRAVFDLVMPFELAVVLAFLCGLVTAFVLARRYVFTASELSVRSQFGRFVLVNLFALALTWGISVGLARFFFPAIGFAWHADDIAHVAGVMAPAVTSYFAHRYYSFRQG